MKPDEYRNIHIISKRTPYETLQDHYGTKSAVGFVDVGRVMWHKDCLVPMKNLVCYAEGIGLVSLDVRPIQSVGPGLRDK